MLTITVPERELYDDRTSEFIYVKSQTLQLEHSLVSISKWESKWHKPFLTNDSKTEAEMRDYIRCMTITQNVDPNVYLGLTRDNVIAIKRYIDDSMTATTFSSVEKKKSHKIVTSELIYYWMVSLNIPFECQKWHLNRLLTLIHICDIKNAPAKKMSKREIMNRNRSLNALRRSQLGTKG